MRKQLYLDIKNQLKTIVDQNGDSIFKHFDLWNQQVQFIEEETPFLFPAVFVEFMPFNWQHLGYGRRMAEITIKLHIITQWWSQTADYSPTESAALDYLDYPVLVNNAMHQFAATNSNSFTGTQSSINHNHSTIVDSIEEFQTVINEFADKGMLTVDKPDVIIGT